MEQGKLQNKNLTILYDESKYSRKASKKKRRMLILFGIIDALLFLAVLALYFYLSCRFFPETETNTTAKIVSSIILCVILFFLVAFLSTKQEKIIYKEYINLYEFLDFFGNSEIEAGWFNGRIIMDIGNPTHRMTLNGVKSRLKSSDEDFSVVYANDKKEGPVDIIIDLRDFPKVMVNIKTV